MHSTYTPQQFSSVHDPQIEMAEQVLNLQPQLLNPKTAAVNTRNKRSISVLNDDRETSLTGKSTLT
jgi:hypothetical protein